VSEIKDENLLAGSTTAPRDGEKSLPVMKDGEEPPDMLLALLNNVLPSIINSQQAEIMGTALTKQGLVTIVFFYGVKPTANKTLEVVNEK
jgi:hypothetical protein